MRQVAHAACWRVIADAQQSHSCGQSALDYFDHDVRLVHGPEDCVHPQVAVLAAPGLVALRDTPPLLAGDHANAQLIAHGGGSQLPLMAMALSSLHSVLPEKHCMSAGPLPQGFLIPPMQSWHSWTLWTSTRAPSRATSCCGT